MAPFRQRPLTWLFLIATACLDVVIAIAGFENEPLSNAVFGLLVGQMCIAGAWLVTGDLHRLARGAGFVGAIVGLTSVICIAQNLRTGAFFNNWGRTLGAVSVIAVGAAAAALLGSAVAGRIAERRERARRHQLRFPLIEVFGWTIVVALASIALRGVRYAQLTNDVESLLYVLAGSAIAGMTYALLVGRRGSWSVHRFVLVGAAMATFVVAGGVTSVRSNRDVHYGFRWAFVYLGGLVLVDWLDRRPRLLPTVDEPADEAPIATSPLPVADDDAAVRS